MRSEGCLRKGKKWLEFFKKMAGKIYVKLRQRNIVRSLIWKTISCELFTLLCMELYRIIH